MTETSDDTGAKPWYLSKTIWGGVVAILAGVAGLFGLDVNQAALTEALVALGGLGGGLVALYGRMNAAIRPIGKE